MRIVIINEDFTDLFSHSLLIMYSWKLPYIMLCKWWGNAVLRKK